MLKRLLFGPVVLVLVAGCAGHGNDGSCPAEASGSPVAGESYALGEGRTPWGPNHYFWWLDRRIVRYKARRLGYREFASYQQQCGGPVSKHFRSGFVRAFIDMAEGGCGTLPIVPPRRYWCYTYRTGVGFAAAEEWFAGYKVGTSFAEAAGVMEYNAVPLSLILRSANETADCPPEAPPGGPPPGPPGGPPGSPGWGPGVAPLTPPWPVQGAASAAPAPR